MGLTKNTAFYVDNIFHTERESFDVTGCFRIDPLALARFETLYQSWLVVSGLEQEIGAHDG